MEKILKINEFFLVHGEAGDIASYISKKTGIDLNLYKEVWKVYKRSGIVNGDLYISLRSNKAIRINWLKNRKNIDSIDLWEDFGFNRNPDWTINLKEFYSPKDNLDPFVEFFKNPENFVYVTNSELVHNEELKNDDEIKSERAPKESADTGSMRKSKDVDFDLDVFRTIEYYSNQVAMGKSNSLIISGMAGVGKCHGKGTKIMMFDGTIKNVEDIQVGEVLMGDDSTPRKVISLATGKDKIYKIKPNKGFDEFTCNSEHIICLKKTGTNEIFEIALKDYLNFSERNKRNYKLYRKEVEFYKKEIKIDPYLMGLWIGDGSRQSPCGIETADKEVVDYLTEESIKYNLKLRNSISHIESKSSNYYFSSGSKGGNLKTIRNRNKFLKDMTFYELKNCEEKFIPHDYLINNSHNRKALLAGLIDSDGYQFNKSYSICTKWKNLANQINFLCRSLGYRSYIHEKEIKYNNEHKTYYNVNITGDLSDLPLLLERKKSMSRKINKDYKKTGFAIEEIGYNDYYGFTLDGNSRYLLGDFCVTHNTKIVRDVVNTIGLIPDVHYYFATGTATSAGLYEVLFRNRDKLIVFDDCDDVFDEKDSINMLKGALDTYPVREISKLASTRANYFNSTGMTDYAIQKKYEETGKLPNKFEFVGQVIFISNLGEDEFDEALVSRSLHVDVNLTREEVIDRMKNILPGICPDTAFADKEETLNYLIEITDKYPTKFPLNMRTLIHCVNIKSGNTGKIRMGDKEEDLWKLLVKKYLVRDVKSNEEKF